VKLVFNFLQLTGSEFRPQQLVSRLQAAPTRQEFNLYMAIQKGQVEGKPSTFSPTLNPCRRGREVKSHLPGLCR